MILTAFVGCVTFHALSGPAITRLIDELTSGGVAQDSGTVERTETEIFGTFVLLAPHRDLMTSDRYFDSYLQASVNLLTGYGALRWFVPEGSEIRVDEEIARSVWISENPDPPVSDQHVVADLDDRRLFLPRSTLPLADIRAAIEEFCEMRTGQRPAVVRWCRDDSDSKSLIQTEAELSCCEDPWCEESGTRHPVH